jgi:hypothetical protein
MRGLRPASALAVDKRKLGAASAVEVTRLSDHDAKTTADGLIDDHSGLLLIWHGMMAKEQAYGRVIGSVM